MYGMPFIHPLRRRLNVQYLVLETRQQSAVYRSLEPVLLFPLYLSLSCLLRPPWQCLRHGGTLEPGLNSQVRCPPNATSQHMDCFRVGNATR